MKTLKSQKYILWSVRISLILAVDLLIPNFPAYLSLTVVKSVT